MIACLPWLIAAVTMPMPLWAAAPIPPAATAQSARLEQLLDLLVGEQEVVTAAASNFDASFDQSFDANGGSALEAQFPGVRKATAGAGRAAMIALLRENYATLRGIARGMIRDGMTDAEIEDAIRFYASPTGRKMISAVATRIRGTTVAQLQASAGDAAVQAMGPEDQPALLAFMGTDAFRKIAVLGPRMQQASVDWGQKLIVANTPRLRTAAVEAMQAHMRKLPLKAGGAKP